MHEPNTESGSGPPLSVYHTSWQASAGSAWQVGNNVAIGFSWDAGHQVPQPMVELAGQDVSSYSALTVDQNRCLAITTNLKEVSAIACGETPTINIVCTATLSADGETFSGQITELCTGPVSYAWKGQCKLLAGSWHAALKQWVDAAQGAPPLCNPGDSPQLGADWFDAEPESL